MARRLVLARRLLNPAGSALVVTVDEHEVNHLGVLLERLIPTAIRQPVTIVINPLGQARKQELERVEEYANATSTWPRRYGTGAATVLVNTALGW